MAAKGTSPAKHAPDYTPFGQVLGRGSTSVAGLGPVPEGPARLPFGRLENGSETFRHFRPSQKQFANEMAKASIEGRPFGNSAALPSGMAISTIDDRLALTLCGDWAVQFRRMYVYVGEIKLLPARAHR